MRTQLKPWQKSMLLYALKHNRAALFVDMRLGKTLVALRWARMQGARAVLIIGPYSALNSWRIAAGMDNAPEPIQATGSRGERVETISNFRQGILLTNYETILSCREALENEKFDCVILDESRAIANPKSLRSAGYTKIFQHVPYRMILTGTPAPENELEYFQQLKFLGISVGGLDNYYHFRARYCVKPFGSNEWFLRQEGKSVLSRVLRKHCFFLSRKDVGQAGEKVYTERIAQLPERVRKTYDEAEDKLILKIDEVIKQKTLFTITAFQWLRQICAGALAENDAKIDLLRELIDGELHGQKLVVFCSYRASINKIVSVFSQQSAVIDGGIKPRMRDEITNGFRNNDIQLLICQVECSRFGMDLSAADTAIYYDIPLGLESRLQSEDRIFNINKKAILQIIDLVIENSIDEDCLKSLKRKERNAEKFRTLASGIQARGVYRDTHG